MGVRCIVSIMRPSTPRSSGVFPDMGGEAWNGAEVLQGLTIVSFGLIVLGAVLITLQPNILSKISLRYDCSSEVMFKVARVLFVCATFMIVGPLLMVLNKEILQTLHFDFPLTLSGLD